MGIGGYSSKICAVLLLTLALTACGSIGSEALVPSDDDLPDLEAAAAEGDEDALVKLVLFYGRRGDEGATKRWLERCLDFQIAFCLADRASEIAGDAQRERNAVKSSQMKAQAIEYAEKAIIYEKDKKKREEYRRMKQDIEGI
ncbi:hypothetical protein V6U71_06590 [Sphingopyxis sp. J-6]|uniref:hypothetical protein n=1 Tax=Sphingopyxis sp. J-6 TaxID=3122054 RepID=UPI0039841416